MAALPQPGFDKFGEGGPIVRHQKRLIIGHDWMCAVGFQPQDNEARPADILACVRIAVVDEDTCVTRQR